MVQTVLRVHQCHLSLILASLRGIVVVVTRPRNALTKRVEQWSGASRTVMGSLNHPPHLLAQAPVEPRSNARVVTMPVLAYVVVK